MKHISTDVKQLSVELVIYLSIKNPKPSFDSNLLKIFIPMVVNGTREKAPSVRNSSEIALVNILDLKQSKAVYNVCILYLIRIKNFFYTNQINFLFLKFQECLELLVSMKESFADCVKSLSKESLNQSINILDYQIDETLIKIDS